MSSNVYFAPLRNVSGHNSLFTRIERLMDRVGMKQDFAPESLPLLKIHFGENGNTGYIKPAFVRHFIEVMQEWGVKPFLGDTNTLYVGERGNTVDHMRCAYRNGFAYATMGAPVVILDGLRGQNYVELPKLGQAPGIYIAQDALNADGMVALSHFKLHLLLGYGGAIKNVGMGCAARRGKLVQHSTVRPQVGEGCVTCGRCRQVCPEGAIVIEGGPARINQEVCVGCAECIAVCNKEAIGFQWNVTSEQIMHYMAEYAAAYLQHLKGPKVFFNFLMDITPDCDCFGHSDYPIVPDIGILASSDPVALDQASIDLVNAQAGFPNTRLSEAGMAPNADKIRGVYPDIDAGILLDYASSLGMGSRSYQLIQV